MTPHQAAQAIKPITIRDRAAIPRSTRSLVALLLLLATMLAVGASAAAYSPITRTSRNRPAPIAVAARELTLYESGNLHLVSHTHEQIVEAGHGTGTLSGHITVRMTLAFSHASVSFTAYPSNGGTVVGHGEGTIYAGGKNAHFTGSATIAGGTGKYAHASGRNIHLEGTLQRHTFALYVKVEGKLRY
jgi:hypothetical protein